MGSGDLAAFEENYVVGLEAMATAMQPLTDDVGARCRGSSGEAASFCNELWDGMTITLLRAQHSAALYRSISTLLVSSTRPPT